MPDGSSPGITPQLQIVRVLARDGREGLDYALGAENDLIVLELLLPKLDGLRMLRAVPERGIRTPVLLLTARDALDDRVKGLDAGADDYLVKPFAFAELLARLRALLRRPALQTDVLLRVGDLEMDTASGGINHLANQETEKRKQVDCIPRHLEPARAGFIFACFGLLIVFTRVKDTSRQVAFGDPCLRVL